MFTSMRMFDEARHWAERASRGVRGVDADGNAVPRVDELIGRQAEWSEETADYQAAVEMYIKARSVWQCLLSIRQCKTDMVVVCSIAWQDGPVCRSSIVCMGRMPSFAGAGVMCIVAGEG